MTGLIRRTAPAATALPVRTPADLDLLVEAIAGHTVPARLGRRHQGEHLYVSERVVISPCGRGVRAAGGIRGRPGSDAVGAPIEVGTLLGPGRSDEVRSPVRGVG